MNKHNQMLFILWCPFMIYWQRSLVNLIEHYALDFLGWEHSFVQNINVIRVKLFIGLPYFLWHDQMFLPSIVLLDWPVQDFNLVSYNALAPLFLDLLFIFFSKQRYYYLTSFSDQSYVTTPDRINLISYLVHQTIEVFERTIIKYSHFLSFLL